MKYDYLVVGSGLYGAIFAHEAKVHGKTVLVVDKRPNIAGNIYTENIEGINVHKYGAHIFHTMDSMFESNTYVFRDLKKSLREIIAEEKGMVTLNSQFKSIDIRDISDNYRFIGGKEQCAEFIKKSLASMPQERCVNKTIQRTYRREDIPDAVFTKSHRDVEY